MRELCLAADKIMHRSNYKNKEYLQEGSFNVWQFNTKLQRYDPATPPHHDPTTASLLGESPGRPIAHADTPSKPVIDLNSIVILQGDTEVIHPSLKIGTDIPYL